jgi:3D (Asp-Asp-Asp) domain-containing protein
MTTAVTAAVTGAFLLSSFVPVASALGIDPSEGVPSEPTYPTLTVKMTAYNALPGQTDSTPDRTSIGAYTNPDIIAARSRDLADELPYGTVIEVVPVSTSTPRDVNCGRQFVHDQIGLRVIGDAMNPRITNTIDILMDHKELVSVNGKKRNPAKALGMCKNVTIKIVGKIDTKNMPKTQDELKLALETRNIAIDDNLAINK